MLLSRSNTHNINVKIIQLELRIDYIFLSRKFLLQYAHMYICYRSEFRYVRHLVTTITITQLVSVATAFSCGATAAVITGCRK